MQTDDNPVTSDLHVGFDELHASQLDAAAEGRHRVRGQFVAVLRIAAVGHDPHLRAVEIPAGPAQREPLHLDRALQRPGLAAGKGDIGPNRIGALPGKTVRQLLRRGRGGFGLASVAEVPGHARHVGETVERETDLLHPGGEVVADDHAGLRVVHGDRSRQFAHRPGEGCDDRLDNILSGCGVGMFHGFRGLCRGGFAVAEHPQHAAERRDVTVEREGHGLVHRRGGGVPADCRLRSRFRPRGVPRLLRAGGKEQRPGQTENRKYSFQTFHVPQINRHCNPDSDRVRRD